MRHLLASPTPEDQQYVDLIKARGLRSVNLRQVIAESYPIYSPSGPLRPHPSPSGMVAKKVKAILDRQSIEGGATSEPTQADHTPISPSIELSRKRPRKVSILIPPPLPSMGCKALDIRAYFLKKYGLNYSLQNDEPSHEIFGRITKLKGAYMTMEVKKNKMEDALKSIDTTMKEQKVQCKAKIVAQDVELEKLHGENRALVEKDPPFRGPSADPKGEHQRGIEISSDALVEQSLNVEVPFVDEASLDL
ncbi:hypothetical protein JCGZ_22704 [Jatropha curcas]|uniref:Uncharacterized protein n=1 Tax=Jatropha curcas TaxID=180498 RepID=A0A067K2D7_JATCU|nr:hypothetical protein JCGZ_22704 [Jatropha curcas]